MPVWEAALVLGVDPRAIQQRIRSGEMAARQNAAGEWLIPRIEVRRWLLLSRDG